MAMRLGMTSRPYERIKEWQKIYPNLRNWRILETGLTYNQALKKENDYRNSLEKFDIESQPGGMPKQGFIYCIYVFEY